jgi:hypothetical protein
MKALKYIITAFLISLLITPPMLGQNGHPAKLKAVLIVGHQEDNTGIAIKDMDKIADLFAERGVEVYKFYDEKAIWEEIIKVAEDCNFFIYSGHGSNRGRGGNAGGICINSVVSSFELEKSLRLKDNALALFQSVCNGAGSSADDDDDIGIDEAKKRVSHYAYPFFEVGASAYYANNHRHGVRDFLNDFFDGMSLKEAYVKSTEIWTKIEFEEPFSEDATKLISIASSPGGGMSTRTTYTNGVKKVERVKKTKSYSIAYVGNKAFSIKDM